MITPNDIRNPNRKSGYDYVSRAGSPGPNGGGGLPKWFAQVGRNTDKRGRVFLGPRRATELEAAQDYCDWYNAQKLLTIEDIRNPKLKSGFRGVWVSKDGKSFHAQAGTAKVGQSPWFGPTRHTAAAAAQDRCDYENSRRSATPATLATHGHARSRAKRKVERTPRELEALKVLREEAAKRKVEQANYVYLVGMIGNPLWVKIGEAYDPEDRYIGGQTFNPYTLTLLGYRKADAARDADKVLHRRFAAHHHKAEWFDPSDEILSHFNTNREEFLRRCGGTTTKEVKTV